MCAVFWWQQVLVVVSFCPISRMRRTRILFRVCVHLVPCTPWSLWASPPQIPTQMGPLPPDPCGASVLPGENQSPWRCPLSILSSSTPFAPGQQVCTLQGLHIPWGYLPLSFSCYLHQEHFLDLPKAELGPPTALSTSMAALAHHSKIACLLAGHSHYTLKAACGWAETVIYSHHFPNNSILFLSLLNIQSISVGGW